MDATAAVQIPTRFLGSSTFPFKQKRFPRERRRMRQNMIDIWISPKDVKVQLSPVLILRTFSQLNVSHPEPKDQQTREGVMPMKPLGRRTPDNKHDTLRISPVLCISVFFVSGIFVF